MFELPEKYKTDVEINLKDFIPKTLKVNDRKRIRNTIKSVKLEYQITGEEIPSVNNADYRCQVIQFYDIEIENIRDASYLVNIYQNIIKPLCVIHLYDTKDEIYSFAIKRLNQNDDMQIIIEENLITDKFMLGVPDSSRDRLLTYMEYIGIKNKTDKLQLYKEWFYKAYMVVNKNAYDDTERLLNANYWYDVGRTTEICKRYMELVAARGKLKRAITNKEKMEINKEIKQDIKKLDREIL